MTSKRSPWPTNEIVASTLKDAHALMESLRWYLGTLHSLRADRVWTGEQVWIKAAVVPETSPNDELAEEEVLLAFEGVYRMTQTLRWSPATGDPGEGLDWFKVTDDSPEIRSVRAEWEGTDLGPLIMASIRLSDTQSEIVLIFRTVKLRPAAATA